MVGPHLLLANAGKPRPVLVARVRGDGTILLPSSNCLVQVGDLDATEKQIAQADGEKSLLRLAPWEGLSHQASAAFVFDLITIPERK